MRTAPRVVPKVIGTDNESLLDQMCRFQGITITKIPDGCRTVGRGKLFRVKTPFDRLLSYRGHTAAIDYKTTNGGVFSYSMIDRDQAIKLLEIHFADCLAGYIITLRSLNQIVFFDAETLFNLKPHSSLGPEHGLDLGTFVKPNLVNLFPKGVDKEVVPPLAMEGR